MLVERRIENALVVTPTGIIRGGVGINKGKIACIFDEECQPEAGDVIDATGQYLIPGLVDPHSHHGTYRSFDQDIRSESRGSIVGGITTMGVMTKVTNMTRQRKESSTDADVVSYLQHFDEARDIVDQESSADAVFHFSIMSDEQAREIPQYADVAGVTTFKFYFGYRDPRIWLAVPPALGLPTWWDDGTAYLAFREIAQVNGLALCHAENCELVRVLVEETWKSGKEGLEAWNDKSPGFVEAHDIRTIGALSQWTQAAFYIVHCSSRESLDEIERCKDMGLDVMAETEAHYLTLAIDEDPPAGGNWAKVNTPIRTAEHREALWGGVASGALDTIGTDNVAGRVGLLQKNSDIWHCRPGFVSAQFSLPVLMTHVAQQRTSIERVVEMASANGAKALRLYPQKGTIQVGSDADLVLVDPQLRKPARASDLVSEADYLIYEGRELEGWPTLTLLRGEVVARDGAIVNENRGTYLKRT